MVLCWLGDKPISLSLPDSQRKELDFTDTSFFAAGPERQLPATTQVRALSKDGYRSPQPKPVNFEDIDLIVKFGPHVTTTEALNLWMVKKVFGDDIPVPEIFGWRVDDDGFTFIYMELIRGPTLEKCWETLSTIENGAIKDQLSPITGNLRNLAQDPSEQFICMVEDAEWNTKINVLLLYRIDYVLIDQPHTGPFSSIGAFNDWFAILHQLRLQNRYDDPNRCLLPDDEEIKLSHADHHRRNIILSSTSPVRVALVDWQQSGWYPDYWGYCKALFTCWYEDEWRKAFIDKFLEPRTDVFFVFSEYTMAMGAI